jgi:hypothetical protein
VPRSAERGEDARDLLDLVPSFAPITQTRQA